MKTYKAIYDPINNDGVYGISLVKSPAMEGLFIALSEDEKKIQLKTIDEEKRILVGLVLEPDKPIYRNQGGEEFNIIFDSQTVESLCYGFSKNKYTSNSTIEHNTDKIIEGVTFVENWLVRDEKIDTAVALGLNAKLGSWVSVMKVDSDEVWNEYVKTGLVQGFSVDAMLSLEEINLKSEINMSEQAKTNSLLEKILLAFTPDKPKQEEEIKLGSVMLLEGGVKIEFDGEVLENGIAIWVMAEDGTKVPVPVGEHPLEDGTLLVVTEEGIVGEVKAAVEEEAPAPAQDLTDTATNDAQIAQEIESAIKSIMIKYSEVDKKVTQLGLLEKKIEDLQKVVLELSKQPASKPIKSVPNQAKSKTFVEFLNNKL